MDRERTNRERERIFEATRQSYRTAIENAFALQERTLEIARSLLESSAEASRAQAERNRALLEDLAEQSRRQREILENLLQETTNAYVNVLWAPFSYYQEVLEAMTPTGRRSPRSQESSLPIGIVTLMPGSCCLGILLGCSQSCVASVRWLLRYWAYPATFSSSLPVLVSGEW